MKSVIATCVIHIASKAKNYLFCILSAVLLILSFPNYNIWLLAWFGFIPLFFAVKDKSKGKAFLLAYFTGIIFWAGVIYWLMHVTLLGLILLVLYLALYFGIFGLILSVVKYKSSVASLLFIPVVWVILEFVREHLFTGFPWTLLGYSQYLNLPIIQIADITGVWGVSFLVMLVNVMLWKLMQGTRLQTKRIYLLCTLCVFATLVYGYYKIHFLTLNPRLSVRQAYPLSIKVSVIQSNIPQELKWEPTARDYILDRFTQLTERAAGDNPDLIVWPEASSPEIFGQEYRAYERILNLSTKIKIPLLIGAVVRENEKYFNSALLISGSDAIGGRYDKLHLVPFGEYIPLKRFLPFLETIVPIGDFNKGREHTIFRIAAGHSRSGRLHNFAVLICFEDLFPELSRQFTKRGADFLINITNDAWYKKTSAPYQHMVASVFRAVENRIYLVRAANTGISGFIAPSGKITSLVHDQAGREIFVEGYRTQEVTIVKRQLSFYSRYGDVFIAGCFLLALYVIISALKKK